MKKNNIQRLCLVFLLVLCSVFSSCKISENIIQGCSEVDFSTPQAVQIYFNEQIYNVTIALNKSKLEVEFKDDKSILNGAYVCITDSTYKITYMDMTFNGDKSALAPSFLPSIIYDFIFSFEEEILLENYNEERGCCFTKENINGYFVTLECYESESNKAYSIEIK